jgi:hypothetical protein
MRNLQSRLADSDVAEEQNVQIQRSRPIGESRRPVAPKLLLDPSSLSSSSRGSNSVSSATTAFTNRGCSANPTGSVE